MLLVNGKVGFMESVCEARVSALSPETVLHKNLPCYRKLKNKRKENGTRELVRSNVEIRSKRINVSTESL